MLFHLRIANAAVLLHYPTHGFCVCKRCDQHGLCDSTAWGTDAWIVDDGGRKVADFDAIKKHYLRMTELNLIRQSAYISAYAATSMPAVALLSTLQGTVV